MTMRSYDDIEFRPWYLPDTARWLKLSLGARGLVAELLRKLDRHGRIALGVDPASDLAVILRLDEDDTRKALTELLAAGRLTWDPIERLLTDPDLPARMRLGSAARMAKKRERDAAKTTAKPANDDAPVESSSQPVTPVTPVTSGVISSPSRSDLPLICSESDLGSRSEDPDSSPRAGWGRNASLGQEARDVFAVAVTEAIGRPFGFPHARFHVTDLLDLLASPHAPTTAPEAVAWLRQTVTAWVKSQEAQGTWHPSKLLDWLNAGRPSRSQPAKRGPGGGPRGDRQGLDGWTPPPRTGTDDDPFGGGP